MIHPGRSILVVLKTPSSASTISGRKPQSVADQIRTITSAHKADICMLKFSRDGKYLAVGAVDGKRVG